MSEPRLISPMLDNFAMGAPMSEHHGVRCCPAMREDSDNKYIVKIISIPASQVQLDALLLTGAYQSNEDARAYFKEVAEATAQEVEVLNRLSKLEGFLPYEACQIEPMDDGVGFEVYLRSEYRRSLERFLRRHTITHLNAVNLGLDMCASLAVCRRAGYLYVDLKPSNIFISQDNEFRIGDLGFVELSSLQYASLPDKYRSEYTAPEVEDAFSSLNTTMDIYAAGLILYQAYNDGRLPTDVQPGEPLPSPDYADYEMAEIILKACAPKPEDRWQDPIEMGQAIVSYMQRNGANDVPIVPAPVVPAEEPQEFEEAGMAAALVAAANAADDAEQMELEELKALLADDSTEDVLPEEDLQVEEITADPDDPANLSFMQELVNDETAPAEEMAAAIAYEELSDETSDILSLADDLLAHETPEGVVAPEPIEVPMPEPIVLEPETPEEAPEEAASEEVGEEPQEEAAQDDEEEAAAVVVAGDSEEEWDEDEDDYEDEPRKKKPVGKIIAIILAILALLALLVGGYFFYTDYYLQTISAITLTGDKDRLTVQIETDTDEALLQAVCTDTYGNKKTAPIVNGQATFDSLSANTLYTVKVEISGLHKLVGSYTGNYTTSEKTNVVSFQAIAGAEQGSVILRFTVDGVDPDGWKIAYSCEGSEEKVATVSNHMATIAGLNVDTEYNFRLVSDAPVYIVGNYMLNYTVPQLILAENLTIESCSNGSLTASWKAPEGITVESWNVRCYNEDGYSKTVECTGTTVTFTDLDCTQAFNVEVTAKGMTASRRAYVTANSLTVTGSSVKQTSPTELEVSWTCEDAPANTKWLLIYTVDSSTVQEILHCDSPEATIENYIPGATYHFNLQTETGSTVFGGMFDGTTTAAESFEGYKVKPENMTFSMCIRPENADWDHDDVKKADYTTSFAANSKAGFVIALNRNYDSPNDKIVTMFVIRDENGMPVIHETSESTWKAMWSKYYCELDVPSLPEGAGNYTVSIYFNGAFLHTEKFQITA